MIDFSYKGKEIQVRDVLLKDSPICQPYYRKVSNTKSHDLLLDQDSCEAFDDDAEAIDNSIYFYVSNEEFDTLSDGELTQLVADQTEAFVGTEEEM